MNTTRSTCWSLTIANPGPTAEEEIALARQKGWEVRGQLEKGEGGLVHYQLLLKTPQVRFSAVKKAFSASKAHIEIARNPAALENYVGKEQSRVGQLTKASEQYPSLMKYWDLIYAYCTDKEHVYVLEGKVRFRPRPLSKEGIYERVDPLTLLDDATRYLIRQGFVVEGIACNPSTRSQFKNFALAIFDRCVKNAIDRQTDRQDDASETSETVTVPMVNEVAFREDVSISGSDEEEDSEEDDEGSGDEGTDASDQESDFS